MPFFHPEPRFSSKTGEINDVSFLLYVGIVFVIDFVVLPHLCNSRAMIAFVVRLYFWFFCLVLVIS